jgi:hypothetical protein
MTTEEMTYPQVRGKFKTQLEYTSKNQMKSIISALITEMEWLCQDNLDRKQSLVDVARDNNINLEE